MNNLIAARAASPAWHVWKALFLREATARLAAGRLAWVWILAEPVLHIAMLVALVGVVRHKVFPGADTVLFILMGIWGYFLVRNVATRGWDAIDANAGLFVYRQIRPVDTVLVRTVLEAYLHLNVLALMILGCAMAGIPVMPADPLLLLGAATLMWLLGVGLALCLSVLGTLLPQAGKVARMALVPLYFASSVMYPASAVPQPVRGWLMLNPIPHGLEIMRGAYFGTYHEEASASAMYLAMFAITAMFLGLVLHVRYAMRLVAR